MFILQMNLINTKENLFFQDPTNDPSVFIQTFIDKYERNFFKQFIKYSRFTEGNTFILRTEIGFFKSIESARKFFTDFTDSDAEVRQLSRSWNQQNNILTKVEIVNAISNMPVRQLLNCLTNTCERFNGVCDETNGCSTVKFAREYSNSKKPFPIKVVVG